MRSDSGFALLDQLTLLVCRIALSIVTVYCNVHQPI